MDAAGSLLWEFPVSSGWITDIVLGVDGTIYFAADRKVFALHPDGTQKWEFTARKETRNAPAVTLDGMIVAASFDGNVYALDQEGSELWRRPMAASLPDVSLPLVDHGIYLADSTSTIAGLSRDGTLLWRTPVFPLINTGSAVGEDGSFYFATLNSYLFAVEPDGTVRKNMLWSRHDPIVSSLTLGADGSIFFTTREGYLVKLDKDFEFKGSFLFGQNNQNWIPPGAWLVSPMTLGPDGTLYLGGRAGTLFIVSEQTSLPEKGWPALRRDVRQSRNSEWPTPALGLSARLEREGILAIEFPSMEGAAYRIEISADLKNWDALETISGNGSKTVFKETIEAGIGTRFYRVQPYAEPGAD